jgi:hypothetical protein
VLKEVQCVTGAFSSHRKTLNVQAIGGLDWWAVFSHEGADFGAGHYCGWMSRSSLEGQQSDLKRDTQRV